MKKLLLIISAVLGITTAQAQYLKEGDIVSIHVGYWEQTSWYPENVYEYRTTYMEASSSGIKAISYATDNCLWELDVDTVSANTYTYSFRDLTTGMYLKIKDQISQESALILADNPSAFYFTDKGSTTGVYMYGQLYFKTMTPWNSPIDLLVSQYADIYMVAGWNPSDIYIEKWEQKGAGKPTGHFNPSKIEFSYVGDQEGEDEKDDDLRTVKFTIDATTDSYYQCVNRPDEARLCRTTGSVNASDINVTNVYWLSDSNKGKESKLDVSKYVAHADENRTLLTLSNATQKNDDGIYWEVIVSPEGLSPMGLKDTLSTLERWIDYADNVVLEYTYKGGATQKAEMRVVRKSYHQDTLPALTFSINPVTYTFAKGGETKVFDVVATHQHGTAIYNVDNQLIDTTYTVRPQEISLLNNTLSLTSDASWLTAERFGDKTIKVSASANDGNNPQKRSATLTGTITLPADNSGVQHKPVSFTIPLHQRGQEGGIQFQRNIGAGNTAWGTNPVTTEPEQLVHTAERTIYYLPNQEEIELRLSESGFSGYMRWYDYETGGDPYYNENAADSTTWVRSPRAADGSPFSAINTPQSAETVSTEGRSYGLYAINKADGGVLNEDNPSNQAPILKGWENGAAHTIACDVSAYTDYRIVYNENNQTRIDIIQEPTLSYRQLFHLRPAQEMVDTLKNRSARGEYLEEYKYQAPAGKQVLLSTQYRYRKARSHSSEMCYFFKDVWGILRSISSDVPVKWFVETKDENGNWSTPEEYKASYSAEMDYLIVRSDTYPTTMRYSLHLPKESGYLYEDYGTDLLIARFEVKFVDIEKQGPTPQTIITPQRINSQFNNLKEITFDTISTHLPWEQASYGYVYTTGKLDTLYKRGASQGAFPFYGEYMLTDSVNKDWARASAHRGKALYVDGTMEPGLVASISADATICSGQTMYCSAWFCNPAPSGWSGEGNPIFRCNIQGREAGSEEWEDVGVYFVGELLKGSGWQQIVFPIESAHNYAETRVSIYNFATTNQGNDFMVDDITLFVSRLPIAAYQGKMACRSTSDSVTNAAAILRLDYSNINAGADGYMFYQIFNETFRKENNDTVGFPVNLTGDAAYYHDYDDEHGNNDHNHPYGSVHIPAVDFNPETYNDSLLDANSTDTLRWYYSVSKILDNMVENNLRHEKAYVKTENDGAVKWLLYVAHLIENTDSLHRALEKLYDEHTYVMRMAYTPEELPTAECNLTTPLHATQQTVFKLRNSNKATIMHSQNGNFLSADNEGDIEYIFYNSLRNCPNDLYFLTPTIVNHLAVDGAGTPAENIAAPVFADWLVGDPKGDVLSEIPPVDNQEELAEYNSRLQASIKGFEDTYGYTHGQVSHAIMYDMRRLPTEKEPNPNYYARTFEELQPMAFESKQNYEIIKHLYENEWLQLYDTAVHFYLGANDTARYWCFPIAETAKAMVTVGGNETAITLKDCNEPHRVYITSANSEYFINIAPIEKDDMTSQQKKQLPTVMMVEGSTQVVIPVKEIGANTSVNGLSNDSLSLAVEQLTFMDMTNSVPMVSRPTPTAGDEYVVRLQINDGACGSGYVFFKLQVLPATMIWSPAGTSFNGWGKNENWKGLVYDQEGNVTDTVEGFVPTSDVNVVISKLNDPLLYPYIVPVHEHNHYPMTVGFQPHHCKHIYFESGARIHNQHLLEYDSAFVDMSIKKGEWTMVAAPLQSVYSGDMYIPHRGAHYADASASSLESSDPFYVAPFSGSRSANAPFAFWASFYNKEVSTYYDDGTNVPIESNAAEFVQSNSMREKLLPGSGFMLWGAGPDNYTSDTLTVRLPKSESVYYSTAGNRHDVPRNGVGHKLAFLADHATDNMQITLSNEIESQYFLFGNPTMAYIDMRALHAANSSIWSGVYYKMQNNAYRAAAPLIESNDRYLPPMTSVLLKVKNDVSEADKKSMTIVLNASHLTLNNMVNPADAKQNVQPARRQVVSSQVSSMEEQAQMSEVLTIYALLPDAHARVSLATNPMANDYYVVGEDAIFLSSGVENKTSVTSPLNIYTLAEQVPMMADVRQGISDIPLSVLVDESYRTNYMQLAFYYSANWSRTCYFCDSYTGQKIRIMDGLIISVEMPQNHEPRYYIEGPDMYQGGSEGGVTTSTTNPSADSQAEASFVAYSPSSSTLNISCTHLIKEVVIYDLSGRNIVQQPLDLLHSSVSLPAPSGICVVKLVLRDGTALYQQALVK